MKNASKAERQRRAFKRSYYTCYFVVYILLLLTNWIFLVNPANPLSVLLFITMAFLFIGLAYNIVDMLCYYIVSPDRLPSMDPNRTLPNRRVALLYCTFNDLDESCLRLSGNQDYPASVFVLDDSTDPRVRATVDAISSDCGFSVIRRPARIGYKAGALNNWMRMHGAGFDYMVILDSDSQLPSDFVRNALRHAEHPENSDVSIFQGKVEISNRDTAFTRLLSLSPRLWYPSYEKLANRLDWMMCWGHNVMLRVAHVRQLGGWDPNQVSEDFALALNLRRQGRRAVLLPVLTFEKCPPDFTAYTSRACRWAKGTLRCFSFLLTPKIPLSTRFMLFITGWCTLAFFGYLASMLLMVFGFPSSIEAFARMMADPSSRLAWLSANPAAAMLVLFYFTFLIFGRVSIALRAKIRVGEYLRQVCLGMSVNMCLMLPLVYHQLIAMTGRKFQFKVTPKTRSSGGLGAFRNDNAGHFCLTAFLLAGALLYNPMALIYNAFWLGMMVLAPFFIWRWQAVPVMESRPKVTPIPGCGRPNRLLLPLIAVPRR